MAIANAMLCTVVSVECFTCISICHFALDIDEHGSCQMKQAWTYFVMVFVVKQIFVTV
jgi:hypothetical protein